jgi:hypothetical protein
MEASGSTADRVTLELTGSEAFVLSDALARLEGDGTFARCDDADRRVFLDVAAVLEPTVVAAFSADYADCLERARAAVLGT